MGAQSRSIIIIPPLIAAHKLLETLITEWCSFRKPAVNFSHVFDGVHLAVLRVHAER